MQNFLDYFNQSLLFRNFVEVLSGLDNTLLLLIISLPIGFVLSLVFALGRVSKNKILSSVWNYSTSADTHTVETHIYRLRKKISKKFMDENFILNYKNGYSFWKKEINLRKIYFHLSTEKGLLNLKRAKVVIKERKLIQFTLKYLLIT